MHVVRALVMVTLCYGALEIVGLLLLLCKSMMLLWQILNCSPVDVVVHYILID